MSMYVLDGKSMILLSGLMTREERTQNQERHPGAPHQSQTPAVPLGSSTEMGAAFFGVMGQSRCHFSYFKVVTGMY